MSAAQAEAAATKKKADERKEKMKSEMLRAKAHIDEQARQHQVRPGPCMTEIYLYILMRAVPIIRSGRDHPRSGLILQGEILSRA